MNKSDFDRFSMALTALAELYGKTISAGSIALWWQTLEDYDFELISKAMRNHTRDPDAGQFMPKPADLIRHISGTSTDKSMLAWGKVYDAMGRVGAYSDVVFDDPAIHAAVSDCGGWTKMCRIESSELSYLQHRFCESYRAYAGRGQFEYPKRLVGDRSPDELYFKRGLPAPRPAIVGDVVKAREVYRLGGGAPVGISATVMKALEAA